MLRLWLVLLLCTIACSKHEDAPTFDPPRRIRPTVKDLTKLEGQYHLTDASRVEFTLPTRGHSPSGELGGIMGQLDVDVLRLADTRGHVRFDLSTLRMHGSGDSGATAWTRRALCWLGLGSQAPGRDSPELRTAEFEIDEITDLSAAAAHDGKRVESRRGASKTSPSLAEPEVRAVTLVAIGNLRIRRVEVQIAARVEARFHYPGPALSGVPPDRITLESISSVPISLAAHDIQPRDEHGTPLSKDLPMLGREVGREARAKVSLVAERR